MITSGIVIAIQPTYPPYEVYTDGFLSERDYLHIGVMMFGRYTGVRDDITPFLFYSFFKSGVEPDCIDLISDPCSDSLQGEELD